MKNSDYDSGSLDWWLASKPDLIKTKLQTFHHGDDEYRPIYRCGRLSDEFVIAYQEAIGEDDEADLIFFAFMYVFFFLQIKSFLTVKKVCGSICGARGG